MTTYKDELISKPIRRHPYTWAAETLVGSGALVLVSLFAFFTTFTTFVKWDDEGYFLLGYRDFLAGRVPYNQLYSVYGPFNFFSAGVIARFNPANVTHDTFRWALLPVWLAIACLVAGLVWRWTGRFSVSIVALLVTGIGLRPLISEIGHPQAWIILASVLLLWIGLDWIYLPSRHRRAFWLGFIATIIVLCKINMGIYAFVAIALAVSLQLKGRVRALAAGIIMLAAIVLGLMMRVLVTTNSEKLFLLAYVVSLILTAAFAYFRTPLRQPSAKGIKWALLGCVVCLCLGIAVTLTWGTTLGGLFRSLLIEPAQLAKSYHLPFQLGLSRIGRLILPTLGIGFAIYFFFYNRHSIVRPAWLGPLKVAVGAVLLLLLFSEPTRNILGSQLFLWLLIVDTQPMKDADYSNRLLLAVLSPLFSLQLLPIAGDQVNWATFLLLVASIVLLADGINCMEREYFGGQAQRPSRFIAGAAGPILAIFFFLFVGKNTVRAFHEWKRSVSVNLYGTHWLRVSPAEKERLTDTVAELKDNCQTVMMIPGLYSFTLWSGVPAAEKRQIDTWPFYWAAQVQQDELPSLRQKQNSCVLVSSDMYQFWKGMAINKGHDELLSEIQGSMTPLFKLDDITLYRATQKPGAQAPSVPSTTQR